MVKGAFPLSSHGVDISGELALESGEYVVEGKGVSAQVNPSRVGSEQAKSFSRPQTV